MLTKFRSQEQHRTTGGYWNGSTGGWSAAGMAFATSLALLASASGPSMAQEPYKHFIDEAIESGALQQEDVAMMVVVRLADDNTLQFDTYVAEEGKAQLFETEDAYRRYLKDNNWEPTSSETATYETHPGSECVSKVLGHVIDWCKLQN